LVVARSSFHLTMGYNHRLCNGAPAARFFHEIVRRLEEADLGEPPGRSVERPVSAALETVGTA
jgi:hypothetical protein